MRLLIFRSVGRMKKQALKKEKKITKSRRIGGLKPQHHCRGAWKQQDKVTKSTLNMAEINENMMVNVIMVKSKKEILYQTFYAWKFC